MKKLLTVWLAITVAMMFTSCNPLPQESSSATESTPSTLTSIYTEFESSEEPTSSDESSEEPASTPSQEQTSAESPQTTSSTISSSNSSGGLSWGENTVFHPVSGLPFKDRANPETGLSWDGVSPIIYTYPDGTTGTEPRNGATYEYLPGKTKVCIISNTPVPEDDGVHCTECGKVNGDGTNGTCCQWLMGDVDCPHCGEHVKVRTCHTCTRGCRYCGKSIGNGLNGTCYREVWANTKCPNCNKDVPRDTCHSCS